MKLRTINNADVKGKRVIIRVDFNTPIKDGVVSAVVASFVAMFDLPLRSYTSYGQFHLLHEEAFDNDSKSIRDAVCHNS